jgi:hypothetical protein
VKLFIQHAGPFVYQDIFPFYFWQFILQKVYVVVINQYLWIQKLKFDESNFVGWVFSIPFKFHWPRCKKGFIFGMVIFAKYHQI